LAETRDEGRAVRSANAAVARARRQSSNEAELEGNMGWGGFDE